MNTLAERLQWLIKDCHHNTSTFSKEAGISNATLTRMINENRDISALTARKICKKFKVNYEWLLDGFGSVYKKEKKSLFNQGAENKSDLTNQVKRLNRILDKQSEKIDKLFEILRDKQSVLL